MCVCVHAQLLSCVWPFVTPWTVAHQASLLMGFFWQEYWNGLPFPSPGYLPNSETELISHSSPSLAGRFFNTMPHVEPIYINMLLLLFSHKVVSDSLIPCGLQHGRLPSPSFFLALAQTHVHWVSDAIQTSHPLFLPTPPALNLFQHQGVFQ